MIHSPPHLRPPQPRRRGFTLIEVLATIVLVAIVLPVAMNGISVALSAASVAKFDLEAATLAENKLNEIVATNQWQLGNLSGDFSEFNYPEFRWIANALNRETGLMEVSVEVQWISRGVERSLLLATLVSTGETQ